MKKTFIVLFIILLSLPLLFFNTDPEKVLELEGRRVTSFPKGLSPKGVENFFNDNLAFKDEILTLKKTFDYAIFNRYNYKLQKLVRKNGHIFSHDKYTDPILSGKQATNEQEIKNLSESIIEAQKYFNSFGAKFYYVVIPNKESIYPEFYPNNLVHKKDNVFDIAFKELKAYSINSLHLKDEILRAKYEGGELLYFKMLDPFHWNNNGAFAGYRAIMQMIKKDFPNLQSLTKDNFRLAKEIHNNARVWQFSSKLLEKSFFRKIYNFDDVYYRYTLKKESNKTVVKGLEFANKTFPNSWHYKNHDNKNGKTLLVFGDSYIYSFMLSWLSESFEDFCFVEGGYGNKEFTKAVMKKIKPDIVIREFVERVFPTIAESTNHNNAYKQE